MYCWRGFGAAAPSPAIAAIISADAAKYNLDPALLTAVVQQESGFNPSAVSSKGAQGLMQLMPGTASMFGVTDPFDPAQNVDAGAHYLSNLLNQYGGDQSLALAAYNAGPGNVSKYGGIPPFAQTQNYVSSILAKLGITMGSSVDTSPIDTGTTDTTGGITDNWGGTDTTASTGFTSTGLLALGALAAGVLIYALVD